MTIIKNAKGDKAAEMAFKNPEKFVLKPQREGGGIACYVLYISESCELFCAYI